jgi:hypothetical protein
LDVAVVVAQRHAGLLEPGVQLIHRSVECLVGGCVLRPDTICWIARNPEATERSLRYRLCDAVINGPVHHVDLVLPLAHHQLDQAEPILHVSVDAAVSLRLPVNGAVVLRPRGHEILAHGHPFTGVMPRDSVGRRAEVPLPQLAKAKLPGKPVMDGLCVQMG